MNHAIQVCRNYAHCTAAVMRPNDSMFFMARTTTAAATLPLASAREACNSYRPISLSTHTNISNANNGISSKQSALRTEVNAPPRARQGRGFAIIERNIPGGFRSFGVFFVSLFKAFFGGKSRFSLRHTAAQSFQFPFVRLGREQPKLKLSPKKPLYK